MVLPPQESVYNAPVAQFSAGHCKTPLLQSCPSAHNADRLHGLSCYIFTRESSYCFQRILAIAILSVHLSVTRADQSKTVQGRITKFSPSAAWKTLVSGIVKLFHKFERGHPEQGR